MTSAPAGPSPSGMIGLAAKQLLSRWLEGLLIVFGLALGVGVLAAGASFLSYLQVMMDRQATLMTEMRAVTLRPKGIDLLSLFQEGAPPAQRLEPQVLEPVQLSMEDVLEIRRSVPGADYVLTGLQSIWGMTVSAIDDKPVSRPAPSEGEGATGDAPGGAPEPAPTLPMRRTTPDIFAFRSMEFIAGSAFTWEDVEAARPVLVVTETLARRLFPHLEPQDAVGHTVSVGGNPASGRWIIVGVVKDDPMLAVASDLRALGLSYSPHTAGDAGSAGRTSVGSIQVAARDPAQTARLVQSLQTHFDGKFGTGRVQVDSPLVQLEELNASQRAFAASVVLLTSLGLIIAAVNVLNLYTARVTRRRRLLGLSAALGASRRTVFWQMLSEALLLGALGSGLGLLLARPLLQGLHGALFASSAGIMEALGMPVMGLSLSGALAGLAAGMGASLIFGAYPAWQASRIPPAEVLRVE